VPPVVAVAAATGAVVLVAAATGAVVSVAAATGAVVSVGAATGAVVAVGAGAVVGVASAPHDATSRDTMTNNANIVKRFPIMSFLHWFS
jgi:hypothetical protein